jgi:hypothetical protein
MYWPTEWPMLLQTEFSCLEFLLVQVRRVCAPLFFNFRWVYCFYKIFYFSGTNMYTDIKKQPEHTKAI